MNTPFGNAITTAEHAIALMFALARQIPEADRSTQAGKWEKSRFMGVELTGKTLGVIGCGNIGAIVAEPRDRPQDEGDRLRPLPIAPERAREIGVEKVELDELSDGKSPISSPCMYAADGEDQAAYHRPPRRSSKTKPGVRIHELRARWPGGRGRFERGDGESGHVAGAALDVFEPGTGEGESPSSDSENLVATPHLGAATAEAQEKVAVQIAEQIVGLS